MRKGKYSNKAQTEWLNKQPRAEFKKKKIAREKGKAQVVEKFGQAQEVRKKRRGNVEMFLKSDGRDQKRLCEGENEGVNIYLLKQR